MFGTEWNLVPVDMVKWKKVYKALPSRMKWLLIETICEFISAYMEQENREDFIQSAL